MFEIHSSLLEFATVSAWVGAPMCFWYQFKMVKTHPRLARYVMLLGILLTFVALGTLSGTLH